VHSKGRAAGKDVNQIDNVALCRGWSIFGSHSCDQFLNSGPPTLVPRHERLGELLIDRHGIMESRHGWVAAPKFAEDPDHHFKALFGIRLGSRVIQACEPSSLSDVIKDRFEQPAPRAELV
jgi:hypothetical protein